MQGDYFMLSKFYMEKIPVVIPSAKVKAQLEKLVERRLGMKPGTEAEAIEQEIDQVVYGLYGLTAEEIAVVEGSVKKKAKATATVDGEDPPKKRKATLRQGSGPDPFA